jgi:hypothetical protein
LSVLSKTGFTRGKSGIKVFLRDLASTGSTV